MDENLDKIAYNLITQCQAYRDEQKKDRDLALKFYDGKPETVPSEDNFSRAVSKDLRATIRKLMPSIMRTILSNDKIVTYEPRKPGDEESAAQATDYVNNVVVKESDAEAGLHDAIFDALALKTGILTWAAYEETKVTRQRFTGKTEEDLIGLDQIGEVADLTQSEDGFLSFTLGRKETRVCVKLRAVPRGAFLIHPNARSIEDSPLVGEEYLLSRSALVARGYDRDLVWSLKSDDEQEDDSQQRRGDDWSQVDADVAKAMESVRVYDVYVLHDADGDGIAEIHHCVMGDGHTKTDADARMVTLATEIVGEIPFAEVVAERDAHQFEGHSIAEDVIHQQEINTTLLRQALDNIRWANRPQAAVKLEFVENQDAIYQPTFGKPIILKPVASSINDVISWSQTPFIADKAFAAMEAVKQETKERTGITDMAGGVTPEQMQQMSATGAGIISDAAQAQAEMMIRTIARGGIRKAFCGLLKLVVANADQPRTVRLRGKWVQFDPRAWDADMDCEVNIGLGGGSRERDMMLLQMILAQQEKVMAAFGPDNPMVKPDQVYNTLAKMVEIAGFPSPDPYFTKPDPAEIQAKQQEAANQPTPEQVKAESAAQLEQIKAEARGQIEQAQMQADLVVQKAKLDSDAALARQKLEHDLMVKRMQLEFEAKVHNDKMQMEAAKMRDAQQQAQAQMMAGAMDGAAQSV